MGVENAAVRVNSSKGAVGGNRSEAVRRYACSSWMSGFWRFLMRLSDSFLQKFYFFIWQATLLCSLPQPSNKEIVLLFAFCREWKGGGGSNGHHTGVGNFMKYQESCEQYLLEVHKKKSQRLKKFSAHKHFRFVHVKKGLLKIRLESKQILSRKRQKWYHSWTKLTFVH